MKKTVYIIVVCLWGWMNHSFSLGATGGDKTGNVGLHPDATGISIGTADSYRQINKLVETIEGNTMKENKDGLAADLLKAVFVEKDTFR